MKKSQLIMVWFLPLIVIGGLFIPLLGYLVVAMMVFFLVLSFFAGRHWCWNLCPRGAFLDIILSKVSPNKPLPKIYLKNWFGLLIFASFMVFLVFRIMSTGGNIIAIGAVFVSMCISTTIIAIILGLISRHRAWCSICPMGFLQGNIGKIKKGEAK